MADVTNRILQITLDPKQANSALDIMNQKMATLANSAKEFKQNLRSRQSGKLEGLEGLPDGLQKITAGFKTFGGVVASSIGGITVALKGVMHGLDEITAGMKESLLENSSFDGASEHVVNLTNGLMEMANAGKLVREGKGLGISTDDTAKIAKLGSSIALVTPGLDAFSASQKIMTAIMTGSGKALKGVDAGLFTLIASSSKVKNATTLHAKQQAVLNEVMANYSSLLESTGNAADSSFGRMIGLVNKLKESTHGLGDMMKGMIKVAGALLSPIAAGATVGFVGGPIGAAIGIGVGTLISAGLIAGFAKLGGKLTGDNDKDAKRMNAIKFVAEQTLGAGLMSIFGVKAKTDIPIEILKSAYGTEDEKEALAKHQAMVGKAGAVGEGIKNFGSAFSESFKSAYGIFSFSDETKAKLGKLGDTLGGSNADFFITIAKLLGAIAGATIGILGMITDVLVPSIKAIANVVTFGFLRTKPVSLTDASGFTVNGSSNREINKSISEYLNMNPEETGILQKLREVEATPSQEDDRAFRKTLLDIVSQVKKSDKQKVSMVEILQDIRKGINEIVVKR